jgi:hypothetical protein
MGLKQNITGGEYDRRQETNIEIMVPQPTRDKRRMYKSGGEGWEGGGGGAAEVAGGSMTKDSPPVETYGWGRPFNR